VSNVRKTLRPATALRAGATLRSGAQRAGIAVAAIALSVAAAMPAARAQSYAERGGSTFAPDEPPAAFIAQRGSLSLSQATAMAQGRFQGRIVSAKTVQQGNRVVHEVRILGNDGRVRTVRIDAETGAFM
jgi:uncharacterized membrane protein YkoI